MSYCDDVRASAAVLRTILPQFPTLAVVLGSGLGDFAETLDEAVSVPTDRLPHWPAPRVPGHEGRLVAGSVKRRSVIALAGRSHLYEGHDISTVTFATRVLGHAGIKTMILTNAAGAINVRLTQGTLMIIDDHINLTGQNPLVGFEGDPLGPRFPDMSEVYSARLRAVAADAGRALDLPVQHGVYAALLGPSYETPAEIRYLRAIGADAVGMSTVPEAIAARQMGIELLGISCITNVAAGRSSRPLNHADVLDTARHVRSRFVRLLEAIIERI